MCEVRISGMPVKVRYSADLVLIFFIAEIIKCVWDKYIFNCSAGWYLLTNSTNNFFRKCAKKYARNQNIVSITILIPGSLISGSLISASSF